MLISDNVFDISATQTGFRYIFSYIDLTQVNIDTNSIFLLMWVVILLRLSLGYYFLDAQVRSTNSNSDLIVFPLKRSPSGCFVTFRG